MKETSETTSRSAAVAAYLSAQALSNEAPHSGVSLESFPEAISALELPDTTIANNVGVFHIETGKDPKWFCDLSSPGNFGRISISSESIEIILGSRCSTSLLAPRVYAMWLIREREWTLEICQTTAVTADDIAVLSQLLGRIHKLRESIVSSNVPDAIWLTEQLRLSSISEMAGVTFADLTRPTSHLLATAAG